MQSKHVQSIAHGLLLVAAMLALIAAALWFRTGPLEPHAQAADLKSGVGKAESTGQQLDQMIQQLEAISRHLADLERGFRDGSFVVQMLEPKGSPKAADKPAAKEGQ